MMPARSPEPSPTARWSRPPFMAWPTPTGGGGAGSSRPLAMQGFSFREEDLSLAINGVSVYENGMPNLPFDADSLSRLIKKRSATSGFGWY